MKFFTCVKAKDERFEHLASILNRSLQKQVVYLMKNFHHLPAFIAMKINIYYKLVFAIAYCRPISSLDRYFLINCTNTDSFP